MLFKVGRSVFDELFEFVTKLRSYSKKVIAIIVNKVRVRQLRSSFDIKLVSTAYASMLLTVRRKWPIRHRDGRTFLYIG
jgi:hypothetical protein